MSFCIYPSILCSDKVPRELVFDIMVSCQLKMQFILSLIKYASWFHGFSLLFHITTLCRALGLKKLILPFRGLLTYIS